MGTLERQEKEMKDFKEQLQDFMDALQVMINDYYVSQGYSFEAPTVSIGKGGRKYIRIVRQDMSQRSVHCFIEVATGDILKAASWASPAKYARGNIFNKNMLLGVGPYGANYR